jgi:uncharacterized membrane protein YebE (DUF533 family)
LMAALSQGAASACLRAPLVVSTVKAATAVAAGQAAASGVISAKVAALTEGVIKAMFLTKLKFATAVLLIAGMLGGGWFASLALWEKPVEAKAADAKRGAPPAPAPKAEKQPKEVL